MATRTDVAGSAGAGQTAARRGPRTRRTAVYRMLRRIHLWLSVAAAVPLTILSVTGALLVFGHELESLLVSTPAVAPEAGPRLGPQALLDRIAQQRPGADVWAVSTPPDAGNPLTLWLADGGGVLEANPYTGDVLRHYRPNETLYGVVRAIHRRWLASGQPEARIARNSISIVSLVLMVQVVVGTALWAIPGRRRERLTPEFRRGSRIAVQRLHTVSGIVTALLLLAVAFTGMAMYWTAPTRALVETATGSRVEQLERPATDGMAPIRDLDAAVALALSLDPAALLESYRPADAPGDPVHVAMRAPGTRVISRAWVGDDPLRVLAYYDGRTASAATWFWQFRYWLHIGDFAGWPVRALWVVVALAPLGFVASGLWLWFNRRSPRRGR